MKKRIFTLLLVFAFAISGCTSKFEAPKINTEHSAMNFNDITYVRPDMDALDNKIAETEELVTQTDKEKELLENFDELLKDIAAFYEMQSYVSLQNDINVNDEAMSDENELLANYYTKLDNKMLALTKAILESTYKTAFTDKMGKDFIERYELNSKLNSPEIESLAEQESALIQDYKKAQNVKYTTTYQGKTVTMDDLDFSDPNVAVPYYEIYKQKNQVSGELYRQLVQIRVQIAKTLGYDNYIDFAYDMFGYDFTPEDAQKFEEAVVNKLVPLSNEINVNYGEAFSAVGQQSTTTLMDSIPVLKEALSKEFPERMQDALSYMLDSNLYHFSDDENMAEGAYSTYLAGSRAPFMFINTGVYQDPSTLFHEFGHYSNFYCYNNLLWNDGNDLNLAEVHSQGLELLMLPYYDTLFGEAAETMANKQIMAITDAILSGCSEDEFQQRVYENPTMSLEEMNNLHAEISNKYFGYSTMYEWVDIHHHFETPFYYISYATSAVSALEIWAIAEDDRSKALEIYDHISMYPENSHYLTALENVGLSNPFDSKIIDDVVEKLTDRILK